MSIKYVEGDLFEGIKTMQGPIVIPHICNNRGAWGAGFVVPLGKAFPIVKERYLEWARGQSKVPSELDSFHLGETQMITVDEDKKIIIANMVAQTLGVPRPLYYEALAMCMQEVAKIPSNYRIVAPMFGSGLAQGYWPFIEHLIDYYWLQKSIDVTIYYFSDSLSEGWTPPRNEET